MLKKTFIQNDHRSYKIQNNEQFYLLQRYFSVLHVEINIFRFFYRENPFDNYFWT